MNPWMMIFLLFVTGLFVYHVSSTATRVSQADYCSSIFPDVVPVSGFVSQMIQQRAVHIGFYLGGSGRILNRNYSYSFSFWITRTHKTNKLNVLEIEATLVSMSGTTFWLQGFWSQSSGELCMVGTAALSAESGNQPSVVAALKLSNFKNSSSITCLISGTQQILSSSDNRNYVQPVPILMLPQLNYEYTFVPGKSGDLFSSESTSSFCSVLPRVQNFYSLNYTSNCSSAKNCLPLSGVVGSLPSFVSLRRIDCSEVDKRIRILVEFLNYSQGRFRFRRMSNINPNMSLIGEGFWDDKKNELYVSLCRFLGITKSWSNAHIGDCTTRLSLGLPAVLSIKQNSRFLGQIWSRKAVNDSGYFNRIVFQGTEDAIEVVPGLRYEYSEINRDKNLCPKKPVGNKGEIYPSGYSHGMAFDINIENSKRETGWGSATPLSVGDDWFYRQYSPLAAFSPFSSATVVPSSSENGGHANISYKIGLRLTVVDKESSAGGAKMSYWIYREVEIAAEGIYDSQTGRLCMIGCRKIHSNKNNKNFGNASMDCEVLLNFQLPPLQPKATGGYIKGSIESMRKNSDPLYFERLDVTSAAYLEKQARESIRRMDLEIAMVEISNTLFVFLLDFSSIMSRSIQKCSSFSSSHGRLNQMMETRRPFLLRR